MNRICVIGSINIDIVFRVRGIARPGETISSRSASRFPGGKGQNQAIALAKAWPRVSMAGLIGSSDEWLADGLAAAGVDTGLLRRLPDVATGSAFIQVDDLGQNCIVLDPGANHRFTEAGIDEALSSLEPGDLVVLQNEINLLGYVMARARERTLRCAFNPSPWDPSILDLPLGGLDYLILNEIEAAALAGASAADAALTDAAAPGVAADPEALLERLGAILPACTIVLTLGADGAAAREPPSHDGKPARIVRVSGRRVRAVDTTAAGDTFTGFFLAGITAGLDVRAALDRANLAASISVTRHGAAISIPTSAEVDAALSEPGGAQAAATPGT